MVGWLRANEPTACSVALAMYSSEPEAALAGEQLIAAWLGMSQLRQNLGVAGPPSAHAIATRVRHATEAMPRAWSTSAPLSRKAAAKRTRPRRK
jgi:hypothetical protein